MPQFITPEIPEQRKSLCAHDTTTPVVFQDYGDKVHRACWVLACKCKKCGDIFIHDMQFGLFEDLKKENECI